MDLSGKRGAGHRISMDTGLRRYDRNYETFAAARRLKTGIIKLSA